MPARDTKEGAMVPDLYDWSNPELPRDMLAYVEETSGSH
jgi:hypothetical protein